MATRRKLKLQRVKQEKLRRKRLRKKLKRQGSKGWQTAKVNWSGS